ncbi:NAD(P)-dependent oxidoreductase [Falsiroseomonas selenitidurans]|uniref:NAD(P)-dependent oxidoreductase n=1 Tax=Falsiroseomonas selenitidurans TaxID=2716335 RepID=A0ABX1E7F4_9PROT|nr:NAD(P)-dependent oxidoreductase [Falsiroseomonas selenitidurans]NKC33122.1 NAD(P)-dependent oxidoreductase [Falsiroseomonas selenitidurans]
MTDSIQPPAPAAFIGLGVMGAAMAANLAKAGYALAVNNRSRGKAAALEASGARWAATPAEAARGAAFVALCLPDTPDVEAVLFGPDGVARGVAPGTVVVDFSTIAAAAAAGFAARLAAETGAILLDSPVSGGPKGALEGTLTCMVGGDAEAFARAEPCFRAMGRTLTHLGPAGSGQVCKSANQLIVATTMLAVAEALALGAKAGLDGEKMRQALRGGSAASFVMENHATRMLAGQFAPGFRAELMRKDLRLSATAMRDHAVFAPATALTAQMLEALVASGRGGLDSASVGALVAELSGLKPGA